MQGTPQTRNSANNMTSASSHNNNNSNTKPPFHTYENAAFDQASSASNSGLFGPSATPTASLNQPLGITQPISSLQVAANGSKNAGALVESPFPDPLADLSTVPLGPALVQPSRLLSSATDSTGTTRTLANRAAPVQNLVTKLISLPGQSPMDSLKDWSVSTFKCTKQIINEKRGICSITNDAQLQNDIEHLRETRNKLLQMHRVATQMYLQYSQLVKSQQTLQGIMKEMSMKCFTAGPNYSSNGSASSASSSLGNGKRSISKQIVANFSSLSNNLSSTTTTSPTRHQQPTTVVGVSSSSATYNDSTMQDFQPILNHIRSSKVDLADDFKKNSIALNAAAKNGEKLLTALNFFCSNLSTLIYKTIEDTLITVKQFEFARLEYDAERNSLNYSSPSAQSSINYSGDRLELARTRYEQLKEDVQIKMRFLEENTAKVTHQQLLLFHSAFASYCSGNTAALESTLKHFSIR